jgi:hypothetical protein
LQLIFHRFQQERKADAQDKARDEARNHGGGYKGLGAIGKESLSKHVVIDPYMEALQSNFKTVKAAINTAALWARRIHHVAISESVIFALADTGEIYSWGGRGFWW